MQIQNNLKCDIFLPYAGTGKGGVVVKAGKMSCDLPPIRFNDPLLQRDWKKRKINVVLSDADRAYLGAIVDGLQSIPITVKKNALEATAPQAVTTSPGKNAPVGQKVAAKVAKPVQPTVRETVTEVPDTPTEKRACAMCGREDHLSMDAELHQVTCSYCKRKRNQQIKTGDAPAAETPPPANLDVARPLPPTPAEMAALTGEVKSAPSSGVPGVAQPLRTPPTLADLMKQNEQAKKAPRPKSGAAVAVAAMGGPLAYMENDNLARQAQKVTP